ncbi:UDP-N-acetylmuramoyl-tripeptide--D-alanyl-D-alanine ligase [Dolosigranulum savutiense]|uniref:UDP-N-acetylmuramoyl-tripeptide--D-alanyl-D-alanine ligase n=1 Tax=Dolosigranulum savutiense TaxID=3110288 RepID=A0AB74TTF7_9LACT
MIEQTLAMIAEAVAGRVYPNNAGDIRIRGVQFDSRQIESGNLFVPLVAERDGHDFTSSAIEKGAVATLWSKDAADVPAGVPAILVDDTLAAYQALAGWYLQEVSPTVVAITGSNGKTTTKDMTAAVVSTQYKTHKTEANYNNHLGVPMTILSMAPETDVIILEMGMDHPGDIHDLSLLAQPDIGVITMIGESHLEFFGSREKIAQAKLELLDGFKSSSILITTGDEPLLAEALATTQSYSFGLEEGNSLRASEIVNLKHTTEFAVVGHEELTVTIPVPGRHNVHNALAALSVGLQLEIPLEVGAAGLATFQLTKNRLEWIAGRHDSQILNDAYNASPSSMKAVLGYMGALEHDGRKLVVLGDMRELGEQSRMLHESLAASIELGEFDEVFLYGEEMWALYEKLAAKLSADHLHYVKEGTATLAAQIEAELQSGDAVLVKSSFGTNLLDVVARLKESDV